MTSRKYECAEAFEASGIEVADLTLQDLSDLMEMIECQLDCCRLDPKTPLQETMRVCGLEVDWTAQGDLSAARIKVSGHYFGYRDVVELVAPKEALVGSWCDSKNVEPFYKAFMTWVAFIEIQQGRKRRNADDALRIDGRLARALEKGD